MREIKFRGWNKEYQKMVYEDELIGHIEYDSNPVRAVNIILNEDDHGYVYMQYTGLKDKNGQEIYEGDVVSTEDGCFEGTTCGIVTEYKGTFTSFYGQDALGREQYDELHTVSGEREVIGNVYQHPHLLEGATNGSS